MSIKGSLNSQNSCSDWLTESYIVELKVQIITSWKSTNMMSF